MIATRPKDGPWPTSTVGVHFDVQLGKMLDAERNAGEPKPYLGNRAVQWGSIDVSAAGVVPLTREDQVRFRLRTNDLLVCEGGDELVPKVDEAVRHTKPDQWIGSEIKEKKVRLALINVLPPEYNRLDELMALVKARDEYR